MAGAPVPQQSSNQIKSPDLRPQWDSHVRLVRNTKGSECPGDPPHPCSLIHSMIHIKNHPESTHRWKPEVFFIQKCCGAEASAAAHHLEWNQLTAEEDLAHDFVRITYHIDQSFY